MKKIRITTIVVIVAVIVIVVFLALSLLHPMLRTVEPQTITYNTAYVGMADQNMTLTATNSAFALWEDANPELVFKKGDDGLTIVFTPYSFLNIDGFAVCPFWNNSEDGCCVFVSLDVANRYPYPANKNYLANTLAHEIGHVLGIMHINSKDNLMVGPVFGWYFDDRGFEVPERLKPGA